MVCLAGFEYSVRRGASVGRVVFGWVLGRDRGLGGIEGENADEGEVQGGVVALH